MPRAAKKKSKVTVVKLNDLQTRKDPKAGIDIVSDTKKGGIKKG